jgi:hypothetical protein
VRAACGNLTAINKVAEWLRGTPDLSIRLTVSHPEALLMMNGNSGPLSFRFYRDPSNKMDATSLRACGKELFVVNRYYGKTLVNTHLKITYIYSDYCD